MVKPSVLTGAIGEPGLVTLHGGQIRQSIGVDYRECLLHQFRGFDMVG